MQTGESQFLSERIRLILADSPATLSINVVAAGIIAFVFRDAVPFPVPLLWFCFTVSVVSLRLGLYLWHRRAGPAAAETAVWSRRVAVLVALTGASWGAGGVVMMSMAPPIYQVLMGCMLGGMASGGMPSLSRHFRIYLLFVVPVLLPAVLYLAWLGSELTLSIAVLGFVLLFFLALMARRQEAFIIHSLGMASENQDLVQDLRREISEREQAESRLRDREDTLARAQEIAHLGSWEWDLAEDRITSSEENNRLFGRDGGRDMSCCETALDSVHPDDRERVEEIIDRAIAEGRPYSCDYRILLPDGSERVIFEQADVTRDETGKAVLVTGINLDITDRYRAQERLREAMHEAEAASEAKSQFLANMSHELRTPLNAIIGYSEILKEDAQETGQTGFIPDLDRINIAGRHLLELINEVLDLSRIEAGRTDLFLETVPVAPVVKEVAATVQPLVAANGNRLLIDCPVDIGTIHTDATKLRQILYNLLSNAAKFTERGEIQLKVSRFLDDARAGGAEWVRFVISDTGIGIAAEELETVFAAFERSEAGRASRYGGTGLGLAICRHYCEMMGGAISVESLAGEGSTFTVRLPAVARDCRPAALATGE